MATTQLNIRLSEDFLEEAKNYAKLHGYLNVQEFMRDAAREKIYDQYEVREEYVDKLIEDEKDSNWLGEQKSNELLLSLGEKALEYKKNEKN